MTLDLQGDELLLAQLRELLSPSSPAVKAVESCDGRRRRRRGSKRARDDDNTTNNGKRRSKKQKSTSSFVTSVPDFDGYRWRKYGQKQIEGAMYARSYYRCTRSAEQGCPAKRTVQRNDDGDNGGAAPKYTVVCMGEHTCTATDSLEAPVILETTAVVAPGIIGTNKRPDEDDNDDTFTSAGSTTTTGTGVESPAISDITWSSSSCGGDYVVDDYGAGLFDVHDSWASSASLQEMEDFTGPIRSPVHVPADGWTIDHFLLQLANNEPVSHFSSAC
ncbi:hypothetical protein SEVIR_7G313500v4 [Setaria viridis]|uniref:WRKY domain-containing protein n=1 Tax=Setaria viridis TaxID=4556 RepID=A0A4U6U062_SETVI|nr:probable WRKY transcription factor 58 [Setaria viridis]TKW07535.1 hypothetical protein SEVIR_7G313500v2 [Setaria viridis]